jgi:hypothetical protein
MLRWFPDRIGRNNEYEEKASQKSKGKVKSQECFGAVSLRNRSPIGGSWNPMQVHTIQSEGTFDFCLLTLDLPLT